MGLQSINDPIDTTTPHGRLTFNIFASLAEFERDIIVACDRTRQRERTKAGLKAARALRLFAVRARRSPSASEKASQNKAKRSALGSSMTMTRNQSGDFLSC